MKTSINRAQVSVDEREIELIAKEYLDGRISLDQAATRVPKSRMGVLDYVLKIILPEDLYFRRRLSA